MFACCTAEEDDFVDAASLRRIMKHTVSNIQSDELETEDSSVSSTEFGSGTQSLASRLTEALKMHDGEGNTVSALDSLHHAKGVLEKFSEKEVQNELAGVIEAFLFGGPSQELYIASCAQDVYIGKPAENKELVLEMKGTHLWNSEEAVNHFQLDTKILGVLKIQELFHFIRNLNEIAADRENPVLDEYLLETLSTILPSFSAIMEKLTADESSDLWIEHDADSGAVHVRIESVLDMNKINQTEYKTISESLSRVQTLDFRVMQAPGDCLDKDSLHDHVKTANLNDFPAAWLLKLFSNKEHKNGCSLRLDFCIQENGSKLLWMDPRTCLPAVGSVCSVVQFDEHDASFSGRCLVGIEMKAGVSELGCASISLPKIILCMDYTAEPALDGVSAEIEISLLNIDWNRFIRLASRPVINLDKLKMLLRHECVYKLRIAPQHEDGEDYVPGYGIFPDIPVPKERSEWLLHSIIDAKLQRPGYILGAFIKMYVASQVSEFGELALWKDIVCAFVADLQRIMSS